MNDENCRSCKYYQFSPNRFKPLEICTKHHSDDISEICEYYTLPWMIRIKKKLRGLKK